MGFYEIRGPLNMDPQIVGSPCNKDPKKATLICRKPHICYLLKSPPKIKARIPTLPLQGRVLLFFFFLGGGGGS